MAQTPIYDRIGKGYATQRASEPAIRRALWSALGPVRSVLNVGAGTGSYEVPPVGQNGEHAALTPRVVALEPSLEMLQQRQSFESSSVVRGVAEALPFGDDSFDACMGVLTFHHWADRGQGLREMRRVARDRIVLLTWVPETPEFWLYRYFPEIWEVDLGIFWSAESYLQVFPSARLEVLRMPRDCRDGCLGAYWARPESYLDPAVRAAISTFTKIDATAGVKALAADLKSGEWQSRFGAQTSGREIDLGYRLLIV